LAGRLAAQDVADHRRIGPQAAPQPLLGRLGRAGDPGPADHRHLHPARPHRPVEEHLEAKARQAGQGGRQFLQQCQRQHPLAAEVIDAQRPPQPRRIAAQRQAGPGAARQHRRGQPGHILGAKAGQIGIQQQHMLALQRGDAPGQRRCLAAVHAQPQHLGAPGNGHLGRAVGRAIIDHQHPRHQRMPRQRHQHAGQARRLVPGGDQHIQPHARALR